MPRWCNLTFSNTSTTTQPVQTPAVTAQTQKCAVVTVKQSGQVQSTADVINKACDLEKKNLQQVEQITKLRKQNNVLIGPYNK